SGRWHHNQKEHVLSWFASQPTRGAGAYSRKTPNTSARTTYNRLMTPATTLWNAEALGEAPQVVREAGDADRAVPSRSRAGAARKVLPWSRIAELAHNLKSEPLMAYYLGSLVTQHGSSSLILRIVPVIRILATE